MSDFRRFFVEKVVEPLFIEGEEFRHAVNVLRIKSGEKIIVCDDSCYEYICEVKNIDKRSIELSVLEKRISLAEPNTKVVLMSGYLKGDKNELVVQKAVELGASEIVFFNSSFCSAFSSDNKMLRLNKVSVEASKQCGRAKIPKVKYFDSFDLALEYGESFDNKLIALEFAEESQVDLSKIQGSTVIVVGSEGGFSKEEGDLALKKGFKTVYLGKRILRAETASISLTAIVMNSLGELK